LAEFEEISNSIEPVQLIFDAAIVIPITIFQITKRKSEGPTVSVCLTITSL